MIKKYIVDQLCNKAADIFRNSNNFIHNLEHVENVNKNAETLSSFYSNIDAGLVKIGCYWHDIGRNDWKAETESGRHEEISADTLRKELYKLLIDDANRSQILEIILSHRNRKNKLKPLSAEAKILWDADKLDIFNVSRLNKIFKSYQNGKYSPEFNYYESFNFYNSIDKNFGAKFCLKESKQIFKRLYPKFEVFINRQRKKLFDHSKKAVLIGGGDLLSPAQNKVNEFILSFAGGETAKILYIAIGLGQTHNIDSIKNYLNQVKAHFEKLAPKKIFFDIADDKITKQEMVNKFTRNDIVYIAGGDTRYLIQNFRKKGFDAVIKKFWRRGKLIAGNSAGALSLVKKGVSLLNQPAEYKGIGLIKNIVPVVHFSEKKRSEIPEKKLSQSILLKENEACVVWGKQVVKI